MGVRREVRGPLSPLSAMKHTRLAGAISVYWFVGCFVLLISGATFNWINYEVTDQVVGSTTYGQKTYVNLGLFRGEACHNEYCAEGAVTGVCSKDTEAAGALFWFSWLLLAVFLGVPVGIASGYIDERMSLS